MNVYKINFLYLRTLDSGKVRQLTNSVLVLADSPEQAKEAFDATHPAGSNFTYGILNVEVLAAGELF